MNFSRAMNRRLPGLLFALFLLLPFAAAHADNFSTLKSLIESGRYDAARAFVAKASAGTANGALEIAFVDALILKVEGRYDEAARRMRAILSRNPNLTRVRGELADTLLRIGDTEGASFNLQRLADSSTDAQQRSFYDSYLNAIRQKRPWTLDAYVALAPSTNINNGVSGDTVVIGGVPFDAASHESKSGIGASFGVAGTYRFDLSPKWDLTFGGRSSGNLYADSTFDQVYGSAFAEFAYTAPKWRVGVGLAGDRAVMGWRGYNWDYGPQLSFSRDLGRFGGVVATAGWRKIGYDDLTGLSGDETDFAIRYRQSLTPSSSFGLGFAYSRANTDATFNGYDGYKPSIELYKELPWGMLGSAQVAYQWRTYRANFPLTGRPRADGQLSIDLAVTFRNLSWKGFAPKIEYTYTQNDSNVQLYSYRSHTIGLFLSKKY